jgi:hypothetical protein
MTVNLGYVCSINSTLQKNENVMCNRGMIKRMELYNENR